MRQDEIGHELALVLFLCDLPVLYEYIHAALRLPECGFRRVDLVLSETKALYMSYYIHVFIYQHLFTTC
jgi:hypothetical protein